VDRAAQHLLRLADREEGAAAYDYAGRLEAELEARGDAEIAAAAAQRPEQVGVLLLVDPQQPSVRRDQLHRKQVVDRQTVLTHHPADAAAERQSADADGRHVAGAGGEPVLLRPRGVLAPGHAGL